MNIEGDDKILARWPAAILILAAMVGYGNTKMPGFITVACALAGFFMSI